MAPEPAETLTVSTNGIRDGVGILITTAILMVLVPALMAVYLRVNSSRIAAATPASA